MAKPVPIGAIPRKIWLERRVCELCGAMARYSEHAITGDDLGCMIKWCDEVAGILDELKGMEPPQFPPLWDFLARSGDIHA